MTTTKDAARDTFTIGQTVTIREAYTMDRGYVNDEWTGITGTILEVTPLDLLIETTSGREVYITRARIADRHACGRALDGKTYCWFCHCG